MYRDEKGLTVGLPAPASHGAVEEKAVKKTKKAAKPTEETK